MECGLLVSSVLRFDYHNNRIKDDSGGLLRDRKASIYDHASWISFHYINLIQTQDALSYWDSGLLL